MMTDTAGKWVEAERIVREQGRVAVAFSGGVDSALLVRLCAGAIGTSNTLAITAVSELTPMRETDEARRIAEACGVQHVILSIRALDVPEVAANPADRCYHCKKAIFGALMAEAAKRGFHTLVDGSNASDRGDWRPGKKAAQELGVISPLDLAGITKDEIRVKSHELGLPNWSAPAAACLATRIPTGTALTEQALRTVEKAEDALIALGFAGVRVRLEGGSARIEAPANAIARMASDETRKAILEALKPLGFRSVSLDMEGYRMGSMNLPHEPQTV